jgi:hypothetical protein
METSGKRARRPLRLSRRKVFYSEMPKRAKKRDAKTQPETLKGWQQIAAYLGHPAAVVQRWASEGMPVRREGRFVTTTPEELNAWLGRESGKPVHVATELTDLAAELKRGLSFVRREKETSNSKKKTAVPKKGKANEEANSAR